MPSLAYAQADALPYDEDPALTAALQHIVNDVGLAGSFDVGADGTEQISFAVVDLTTTPLTFGGVHPDNFIYPASVYKMYVAAEVLRQVRTGARALDDTVVVHPPNAVDTAKEVLSDPRPLLAEGDTVTVGYLLDLMITRSDNSAANVLIDLATRPSIDTLMHHYDWQGSEVTRKFVPRNVEAPGYADVRGTMTSARHAAEFLARVATRRLVGPWVSMQMESLLGRQLDDTKLAAGLPGDAMFYHKTGWWSYWTHDVGIVDDGTVRYIVAAFTPLPEDEARSRLRALGTHVHKLMVTRSTSQ